MGPSGMNQVQGQSEQGECQRGRHRGGQGRVVGSRGAGEGEGEGCDGAPGVDGCGVPSIPSLYAAWMISTATGPATRAPRSLRGITTATASRRGALGAHGG